MTLRTRLVAALATIALVVAVPALYAVSRLDSLGGLAVELRERQAAASTAAGRASEQLFEARDFLRSHVATGEPAAAARADSALDRASAELDRLRALGYSEELRAASELLDALRSQATEIRRLVAADSLDRATASFGEVTGLVVRTRRALGTVEGSVRRESASLVRRAEEISASATRNAFFALGAALFLAALVGGGITGSVVAPLRRLREAMATVAEGRFRAGEELPYERDDEIGDLARSFRSMTARLRELSETKAEFMSAVTHRLKTPAAVIQGYAEMLRDGEFGELTAPQRETLAEIEGQTSEIVSRIDHLLELTRVEAGTLEIEPDFVRVADLLRELRSSFAPLAAQRRIAFEVGADPEAPDEIRVDPDLLRDDVLGNLLSNAFKYTGEGGRVALRVEPAGNRVRFVVEDDGPGIPEEELSRVFEPYYRSGDDPGAGTGLGLSIAREVVELHDGTIRASSTEGEGTTFAVTLPLASA